MYIAASSVGAGEEPIRLTFWSLDEQVGVQVRRGHKPEELDEEAGVKVLVRLHDRNYQTAIRRGRRN